MRMDGVGIGNAQVMCGLVVAESHTPLELKDTTKQTKRSTPSFFSLTSII